MLASIRAWINGFMRLSSVRQIARPICVLQGPFAIRNHLCRQKLIPFGMTDDKEKRLFQARAMPLLRALLLRLQAMAVEIARGSSPERDGPGLGCISSTFNPLPAQADDCPHAGSK